MQETTTVQPVIPARVAPTPTQSFLMTTAFVLEHNLRRLMILAIILGLAVFFFTFRGIFDGLLGLIQQAPQLLVTLLFYAFAMIVQFGALMWFMSRPRTYTVTPNDAQIGLSFNNYRGQPDLLEHAKSLVRILKGVERFQKAGGEMPKGMLLAGPPGTGKTFLAGVVAAEAGLPFVYVDASSITGMFMGMDVFMVISLFRKARSLARKYAPPGSPGVCIMFLDELDAIGLSRGGMGGNQAMMGPMGMMGGRSLALNTMLNQMDSLGKHVEDRMKYKIARWLGIVRGPVPPKPIVFVIGATNRPDVLDPALVRAGRLDRKLMIYEPDGEGRKDILQHYLRLKAHEPGIPVDLMVADSIGWTPIELKTVINEALIVAHDAGREFLTYKDWLTARDARLLGIKQPILSMSAHDRRTIAYHEAGHAIASHYLNKDDRIQKASIIRMGDAYGVVMPTPKLERHQLHAEEVENDIMVSLGSRAVEEIILKTKTANASSDLRNATNRAIAYVGTWGMGSTLLAFPPNAMGAPPQVLSLADKLLEGLFEETKRLIREKEYAVHAIAGQLLQRGELIGPELDEIFEAADLSNPEMAKEFVRRPVNLPKMSDLMKKEELPPEVVAVPVAASDLPGQPAPSPVPQG
jgi:cell division protease FtsH